MTTLYLLIYHRYLQTLNNDINIGVERGRKGKGESWYLTNWYCQDTGLRKF